MRKREKSIEQCWEWDLREPIMEQAGMGFHPGGKAGALPRSIIHYIYIRIYYIYICVYYIYIHIYYISGVN